MQRTNTKADLLRRPGTHNVLVSQSGPSVFASMKIFLTACLGDLPIVLTLLGLHGSPHQLGLPTMIYLGCSGLHCFTSQGVARL